MVATSQNENRDQRLFASPAVRTFRDVGDDGGVGVDDDEDPTEDSRVSLKTRGFPCLTRTGGVGVVGLLLLTFSVILSLNNGETSP